MAVKIVGSYYKCEVHGDIKDEILSVDLESGYSKVFCLQCLCEKLSEISPSKVTKIKEEEDMKLGLRLPGCDPVVTLRPSIRDADKRKINQFDGTDYEFLSNFYKASIVWDGKSFSTVEHFFQAHKTMNPEEFERIRTASGPGAAKSLGNQTELMSEWEEIKDGVMFHGLLLKFTQHPFLSGELIDTEGMELEEGNNWGDKYWGTVEGEGENMLGKLLMKVRAILSNEGDFA